MAFTAGPDSELVPEPRGFTDPGTIAQVLPTDGGVVAVGAAGPTGPGASPGIWRSGDGTAWTEVQLPDQAGGSVAGVAEVDGLLVGVGLSGGDPVVWRSGDGGQVWSRTGLRGAPDRPLRLSGLQEDGGVLVAAGSVRGQGGGDRALLLRSDDQGSTWQPVDLGAAGDGLTEVGPVGSPGDGFWLVGPGGETLLHSEDGGDWQLVDLTGLGGGPPQIAGLTVTDDGDTVVVTSGGSLTAWTWPHGRGPVPTG